MVTLIVLNCLSAAWIWFAITRRPVEIFEIVGAGLAVTFVFIPLIGIFFAGRIDPLLIWLVMPLLVGLLMAISSHARGFAVKLRVDPIIGSAGFIGLFLGSLIYRQQIISAFTADPFNSSAFHPDLVPLAQVADSMSAYGLDSGGLMSDWPVRYHFFSGLVSGTLDQATINEPLTMLGGIVPLLSMIGIAILVAVFTRQLTRNPYIPTLAVLAVIFGRYVADSSGININFDSTSQISSTLILLLLTIQIVNASKKTWTVSRIALLSITLIALTGTKFSSGAVGLSVILFVLMFSFKKSQNSRSLHVVILLISLLSFALPVLVFMTGQNDSGTLIPQNPFESIFITQVPAGFLASGAVVATILALLPSWLPSFVGAARQHFKQSPQSGIFVGAAVAGIFPLLFFENAAPNNYWFLVSATALILPLSLVYVYQLTSANLMGSGKLFTMYLVLASAVVSITWALAITMSNTSEDFAQLTFIVVWVTVSILVTLLCRPLVDLRFLRTFGIVLLWLGALSPVYVVGSETIVTRLKAAQPSNQATSPGSLDAAREKTVSTPTIDELKGIAGYLATNIQPGSEIAFESNVLGIATLLSGTQPFISSQHYAEGLGPRGSDIEYERRLQLVQSFKADANASAISDLCEEGVSVVIADKPLPLGNSPTTGSAHIGDWIVIQLPCANGEFPG